MNLGPHADFVVLSYAAAALIIVVLVAWVMIDYRAQRRALGEFEARGVTRRSEERKAKT